MTHKGLALVPLLALAASAIAQNDYRNPNMAPLNDLPNPYSGRQVMPLADGRTWGSTAGVDAAKGRDDIWAIDRCGSNTCVGSHFNPLLHYDAAGNLIGQMGADLFAFPHGIHVDQDGNVWVTDPLPPGGRGAGGDVGQQVTKLSPTGEVLLQLGTRKVAGDGPNQFSSPSDVVVGRNGDIFVADGHGEAASAPRFGTACFSSRGARPATGRAAPASSRACMRSPSIHAGGSSSAIATTTVSRSTTRTAITSTAGISSAAPVASTSTPTTTCSLPTRSRATARTKAATWLTRDGSAASASAARATARSDT
jgi:hypothetical protein